jgi:hypothetical protein
MVCSHLTTSKPSMKSSQCRLNSSIAFSSTAFYVFYAQLYCPLGGFAPNRRTAAPPALRATFRHAVATSARRRPAPLTPRSQQDPRVLQHHAYRHFVEHLSCVLETAIAFLHLAQKFSITTPPARAVARHVTLQYRLLALMGPLCSGRPTFAHIASFRASPRARSRHPFGVAHIPAAPAPAPALQHASSCTAEIMPLQHSYLLDASSLASRRISSCRSRSCQLSCGRHSCALLPRIHSSCAAQLLLAPRLLPSRAPTPACRHPTHAHLVLGPSCHATTAAAPRSAPRRSV